MKIMGGVDRCIHHEVARPGAQLLMLAALEAEVTEFLGRDRYARAALTEDARPGAKIPAGMQAEVKDACWKVFDTEDLKTPPGPKLAEIIDNRIGDLAGRYQGIYPAAAKILLTDREGLTACLRFPAGHHHRIRHSNFIERTFGETRRRVKVIGRLPGETSCLTLVWAVPGRAFRGRRGLTMTSDGLRLLQDLRRSLPGPPRQLRPRSAAITQPEDQPEAVRATA